MASNRDQIFNAILANVPTDGTLFSEAELADSVSRYRAIFPLDDSVASELVKQLQVRLSIKMESGSAVVDASYKPWLNATKASIDPFFWERYRQQLIIKDKWSPMVVNTLDRVADEILDLIGNPNQNHEFSRKGLIVGDVQSGKTATYTAIACKAADAGYRLIVLLTGTIESLRRQTQIRLDEGFVGRDSSQLLQRTSVISNPLVGVGLLDGRKQATAFTSRNQDFNKVIATQLGFSIENSSVPVLMVCKKNAIILENLRSWLETMNAQHGHIDVPLLLIDDEADSASINTSIDRDNATRTNKEIRQLLSLFRKSTYVGVTATPFANVFIHPDTSDQMLGDDLFPSSFIYALEAPTNYMGPEKIFGDGISAFIAPVDDAELNLPIKHKISFTLSALPESLHEAIRCFLLATTIRDLRNEGATHRSMLINVSRFTIVQEQVRALVDNEIRNLQRQIRLYASLPPKEALKESPALAQLHRTWEREYQAVAQWTDVARALTASLAPVTVTAVNQRSGSAGLDYQANKENGLRVIAVGGNSLSRGLTLEGLSTSYFYRNSIMYDTLLQMGRWFGYRGGYGDLCRLFISDDANNWFEHITQATIDLKSQVRRMQDLGLTPKEFGLKVRAHPDSLIVTARNKMRDAKDFKHYISLSGNRLETVRLLPKDAVLEANYALTEVFARQLQDYQRVQSKRTWITYGGVPNFIVAPFLRSFVSDPMNLNLQLEPISEFLLATNEPKLQSWDVSIMSTELGKSGKHNFAGHQIGMIRRRITRGEETGSLLVSGSKARVGTEGSDSEGLNQSIIDSIKADKNNKNIDAVYRSMRQRPLLMIYLLKAYEQVSKNDPEVDFRPNDNPLIALGLSFPSFDDSSIAKQVPYKINFVEWQSRISTLENDDFAESSIDEH